MWIVVGVSSLATSRGLEIDEDVSAFLDMDDSRWRSYETLVDTFGSDGFLTVVLPHDQDELGAALVHIDQLARELSQIEAIESVESLASYQRPRSVSGSDVAMSPLLIDGILCEGCLELALDDPYLANLGLISKEAAAVSLVLRFGEVSAVRRGAAVAEVRELSDRICPGALISGVPLFRDAVLRRMLEEFEILGPLAALATVASVGFALRSLVIALCGVGCGLIAVAFTMAIMSTAEIPLSLTTFTLPPILIALGMAYTVHVLAPRERSRGLSEASVDTAVLVVVSGVTTSAGFLAMAAVSVPAIRDFGFLGAVGVLVIVLATVTLVPALGESVGDRAGRRSGVLWALSRGFESLVARYPWTIIVGWLVLLVGGVFGVGQLELESDITEWFPRGERIREDYEGIRETVSGITPLSFVVAGNAAGSAQTASAAGAIARFVEFLRREEIVGGAVSYADPLVVANEAFSGLRVVPADEDAIAQLLLILRSNEALDHLISMDGRSANVVTRLDENDSESILGLAKRAEDWWAEKGDPGLGLASTGIMFEYARAQELISQAQLWGLLFALLMIGLVLHVSCRDSMLLGVVLICSVVPAVVVYGAFGLLGVAVDAATVCVGAVALGIAVDDSVHIAARHGGFRQLCVHRDWAHVTPVLLVTTAVVCMGFGVLAFSGFTIVGRLGGVTGAVAALCLVSDLTLLPALLRVLGRQAG